MSQTEFGFEPGKTGSVISPIGCISIMLFVLMTAVVGFTAGYYVGCITTENRYLRHGVF